MIICPQCQAANSLPRTTCEKCGKALPQPVRGESSTVALTPDAQRRLQEHLAGKELRLNVFTGQGSNARRTINVDQLFGSKTRLLIGRGADCDVCLPHPSVSRVHALLERLPEGLRLRDLSSVNGVRVEGRRISEPVLLKDHERVGIGPFLFSHAAGSIQAVDSSQSLRLEARHLEKVIHTGAGQAIKLLQDINLALEPGEFVSLLGPSGSGKSTLMDCLNGRRPATGGRVLANGEDFYRHFDSFRQSLGYVPQRDIVHTQLTVARALYYTARLRLPTDTGPAELQARIDSVVQLMELGPHRNTLVANLSGGQIKRVSLGAELLAQPCLLYIDEATSGLDAGTEARMMRLFRRLADEGKSIVCITHNVDNVDLCNLILVLSCGRLVFFGPPAEGRGYFRVGRISEIYDRLAEKSPEDWEREYTTSALYREFVEKRLAEQSPSDSVLHAEPAPRLPVVVAERPPRLFAHQFAILTARYAELFWKDRRTLRLLLLQAPVVAVILLLGFVGQPYQETVLAPRKLTEQERGAIQRVLELRADYRKLDPRGEAATLLEKQIDSEGKVLAPLGGLLDDRVLQDLLDAKGPVAPNPPPVINPRSTYMLLFIVVISVMWFGCNNAAREIVKEEAIYTRERAINLGILPYLASKFVVLTLISAVQVLLIMLVTYGVLEALRATLGMPAPPALYRLGYLAQYGVLVLLAMTGVALGLLLSACVSSPDRATTLLPYVLIPQIILGGAIMTVRDGPLYWIAVVASPVYWAYRGVRRGLTTLPPDFPGRMDYNDSVGIVSAALVVQTGLLLLLTAWFLRQKDVRRG